jgi:Tripartite tricarboxylate transporter family receptor
MKIIAALCAFFIWAQTGTGYAQTFPDRAIRFIVPNPAGGSNDAAARILANALSELWPHGVVIENRGGGGGNVGAQAAATAPADGYVLLLTSPGPLTINPSLYKRLPFDPEKDFAPVALVATVPIVLMVNPKVPANTVQELIALAKREQGKLNYASSGIGSTHHLAAALFKTMANVELQHVPYRGATCDERSHRRPCADALRQYIDGDSAGPRRQRPGTGGGQSATCSLAARGADICRGRPAGLRGVVLVRTGRAKRDVASDSDKDHRGCEKRDRAARGSASIRGNRRTSRRNLCPGLSPLPAQGTGQMGRGDQGVQVHVPQASSSDASLTHNHSQL